MQLAILQKTNKMKTDITKNKHGGNAQSNAAFEGIKEKLSWKQSQVLHAISYRSIGWTCRELAASFKVGMNAISGRITELKAMGKIKQIGRRDGCAVYVVSEP
jgi:hypothetical protein